MSARTATSRCSSASPAPARPRSRPIPNRTLIGDDEHGWGPRRRVQLRGRLLRQVHQALARSRAGDLRRHQPLRRGAGERRVRSGDAHPRFRRRQPRPRTRARPIRSSSSRNASRTGRAGHPKNIIFLTADAFGVMPPIAKLTPAQAMYHFLSGYTAKVAGTEKGLVGVEPEFSTCFGAPFLPRPPAEYGNLLRELHRQAQGRLLAGQLRLDRRHLRRRPPHADQGDARAGHRRARRLAARTPASAPIRISASRCRPRCRASSRTCSIR